MSFDEKTCQEIFTRANGNSNSGECERCGKQVIRAHRKDNEPRAWEAHHIVPEECDGTDSVKNGAVLCLDCHKRVHSSDLATDDFVRFILRKRMYREDDINVLINDIKQKRTFQIPR